MDVSISFHLIYYKAFFYNFDYFQVLHSPVNSPSWVSAHSPSRAPWHNNRFLLLFQWGREG